VTVHAQNLTAENLQKVIEKHQKDGVEKGETS